MEHGDQEAVIWMASSFYRTESILSLGLLLHLNLGGSYFDSIQLQSHSKYNLISVQYNIVLVGDLSFEID